MKTFKDFLEWYNNLDVEPFVMVVERLRGYYFKMGIDMFKISVSVPGLARQMLFECGRKDGGSFALFDKATIVLYRTIKQNIIGEPSIIFHRFHEKHKTFLRGNPEKRCQNILEFDANALYLYCMDQPMPTGPFVRRHLASSQEARSVRSHVRLDELSQSQSRVSDTTQTKYGERKEIRTLSRGRFRPDDKYHLPIPQLSSSRPFVLAHQIHQRQKMAPLEGRQI